MDYIICLRLNDAMDYESLHIIHFKREYASKKHMGLKI